MKTSTEYKKFKDNYQIPCNICEGTGDTEVGPICWKPASECCGGCYETIACTSCEQTGYISIIEGNERMEELFIMSCSIQYRINKLEGYNKVELFQMLHADLITERIIKLSKLQDSLLNELYEIVDTINANKV